MNDLKPQLAPGWSGVNIAILLGLFWLAKPLAVLMLAYILFGARLGVHLAQPQSFVALGRRIASAWRDGTKSFGNSDSRAGGAASGGTPSPSLDKAQDLDRQARELATERATLAAERAAFEQEKRERAG